MSEQEKKLFEIYEVDRITRRKVGESVFKWAVSAAQACNLYRYEKNRHLSFDQMDNRVVAEEVTRKRQASSKDQQKVVCPAQVLPTAATRPTAKPQAPPAEEKQEELDFGPEFALPPKAQSSGSFSPS